MSSCAVYLDCNATAPVRPEVIEAMTQALEGAGNPSSVHGSGRAARERIETARAQVAALVGADVEGVVFTSGGSEANNMALCGRAAERLMISASEHVSVSQVVPGAREIAVHGDGLLDLERLEEMLAAAALKEGAPLMVSVMLANNETGVIQPIAQIAALAHEYGAIFHCDAVQGAGKILVEMSALGIDLLTLSAHKMGGPQGAGALVIGPKIDVKAMIRGGSQEKGRRAGTQNTPAIAGFGMAAQLATRTIGRMEKLGKLRDVLERKVCQIDPQAVIFGKNAPRLANTSCFTMSGVSGETQVMALDLAGVAVGSGSACSSGRIEPSRVLKAMGASDEVAANAIRVSLGWQSSAADVEKFLSAWGELHQRRQKKIGTAGKVAA